MADELHFRIFKRSNFSNGVKSAVSTVWRSLPVYPGERTSPDRPGSCQFQSHAPQRIEPLFDSLVGERK
jgi:hypothetical protein